MASGAYGTVKNCTDGTKKMNWYMQVERLHSARHVVRMLDNRIPKRILEGSLGGRRLDGKPRNRWKDEVWNDGAKLLNTKKLAYSGKT
jgi:hypothetical protein